MKYAYWLFRVKGLGNRRKIKLVHAMGSAKAIYKAREAVLLQYKSIVSPTNIEAIKQAKENLPLEDYEQLAGENIYFTAIGMEQYPERLTRIEDPPYGILYRGRLPLESAKTIAMIGARECSEYGKYLAKEFGAYLGGRGIEVISGLARGIDGMSQLSAIEAGGYSLGVLGCGVDICYPSEHRHIYEALIEKGGILSEFPLGTAPKAQLFPARNRIISAFSDSILVIEAKQKSGTLITVDQALEQGKDVYAIPGKIVDSLSYGCNYLIKQGATIILSPKDLYDEVTLSVGGSREELIPVTSCMKFDTREQEAVYKVLEDSPQTMDGICQKLVTMDLIQVQCELMTLVLRGDILQVSGNLFCKKYK